MRRSTIVLSWAVSAVALIPGLAGSASATPAGSSAPDSATASCKVPKVTVHDITDFKEANKPGQVVAQTTTIKNLSAATISGATFGWDMTPTGFFGSAPTPSASWRAGHGKWHKFIFTFHKGSHRKSMLSSWQASGIKFVALKPHQMIHLSIKAAFHHGDPATDYFGYVGVTWPACNKSGYASGQLGFAYFP